MDEKRNVTACPCARAYRPELRLAHNNQLFERLAEGAGPRPSGPDGWSEPEPDFARSGILAGIRRIAPAPIREAL
jgi:hypothetical protein